MPIHPPTRHRETETDSGLLNPVRATGQAAAALSEQAWIAAMSEVPSAAVLRNLELTGGAVVSERLNAMLAPLLGKAETKRVLAACPRRAATGEVSFTKALADHPEPHGQLPSDDEQLLAPEGDLGAADELVSRVLVRLSRAVSA